MKAPLKQDKKAFRGRTAYRFFSGAALFLVAVYWVLFSYCGVSSPLYLYLLSLNAALFTLCGFDKSIAGTGATRVPEIALLSLAFIGGSVGLVCGMKLFRHKTRVARFQFFLILILCMQILVYKYIFKQ